MRTVFSFLLITFFVASIAFAGEWTDDFDDPDESIGNWTPIAGEWKMEDGFYKGQMAGILGATITDIDVEDGMTLEVRAQYVQGGWENFSLIFAYVSEDEAYQVDMRGGNETFRVEKFTPNVAGAQTLAQGNQPSNFGEWFDVKVVIDGDTVISFVDEEEIVRYTFPAGLPEGKIGFGGEQSHVEFDHITITGPGVGDMPVSSIGKLSTTWGNIKSLR